MKKKLKDVNTCCFSTIPLKIYEKKNQILNVVLALKTLSIHSIGKNFLPLKPSTAYPQEIYNHKKKYAYLTDSQCSTCLLKKYSRLQHLSQSGHL